MSRVSFLIEVRDGAKARKKLKKKRTANDAEHDGDASGGDGEDADCLP